MLAILRHRGPDESGIYIEDQLGLGHTRLSIIDLSSGSQPIHNEDKTCWIVYNGEVFNYPELKADLLKKGHRFYTTTDTEVILHLFEEMGPACLQLLNGQFAIAIWNSEEKELFLARDRIGIRPLFYTIQNGSLLFASEIKSIFMDKRISRQIDCRNLNQIFTFWTTLPGETVFKDIFELPPGHYLQASATKIKIEKYWDIPFHPPSEHLNWPVEQVSDRIQELLKDAIRIRLRADVPVGCYLSGGLDSSGITALVVKNFNSKVRTFGIQFEEKAFDEREHQQLMVNFLGTDHTKIQATNELIGAALPKVMWHCEKPILRTAPVPLFLLSDMVRQQNFKVVLTGEGADEVFGGYNIFREAKVRNFWAKQPNSKFRGLLIKRLYPYIFTNPRVSAMQQAFFKVGIDQPEAPFFSHQIRWQNTSKIKVFFSDAVKTSVDTTNDYEKLEQQLPADFSSLDYLAKAQYLEMSLFLSNYLLSSQGDRMAMAHSVEIRLPYLDYRLLDFMARVPHQLKIKELNEKFILKKAFQGILPEKIYLRNKHPYRASISESLLNSKSKSYVQDLLSDSNLKQSGLFHIPKVNRLIRKLQRTNSSGEIDNMALVGILSTQLIYEQFITNFPASNNHPITLDILIDQRS